MIITFVVIALMVQALGLCALFSNLQRAPEGFEDASGFHLAPKPVKAAFAGQRPNLATVDPREFAA